MAYQLGFVSDNKMMPWLHLEQTSAQPPPPATDVHIDDGAHVTLPDLQVPHHAPTTDFIPATLFGEDTRKVIAVVVVSFVIAALISRAIG